MRVWLACCILAIGSCLGDGAPLLAQQQPPAPEPPKPAETKKVEEAPNQVVHYTLAAIATLIVMVLICMPARRE